MSLFVIYFSPLPGHLPDTVLRPVDHSRSTYPNTGGIFPSAAPMPALSPAGGIPSWPETRPSLCPYSTVNTPAQAWRYLGLLHVCLLLLAPPHTGPRGVPQGRGCSPLAPCQRTILNSERQAVYFLWDLFSPLPLPPACRESCVC